MIDELKQWIYGEICERRDYSASKTYELVIAKINELEANEVKMSNENEKVCLKVKKVYDDYGNLTNDVNITQA